METKIFGDKKLKIRSIDKSDLKNIKKFQKHINALIAEDAKILMNTQATLKDEQEFVESAISEIKNKTRVHIIVEDGNEIIGGVDIKRDRWRRNHIGKLGIAIRDGYRGIGLGRYIMAEILKLAKKELKPMPKIVQLEVYENNKPAIALYKKMGFKTVGKIPKQIQYKGKLIAEYIMIKEIK